MVNKVVSTCGASGLGLVSCNISDASSSFIIVLISCLLCCISRLVLRMLQFNKTELMRGKNLKACTDI